MCRQKRWIAWIMCFGMMAVLLVSFAYIAHEADHDCTGEACEICASVARTGAALRVMALSGVALAALPALPLPIRTACADHGVPDDGPVTLITRKVRLND